MIEATQIEGRLYYTTIARGVEYTAVEGSTGWQVYSHRIALGRRHVGGVKHFRSLADLAANVKAFAALDLLLAA